MEQGRRQQCHNTMVAAHIPMFPAASAAAPRAPEPETPCARSTAGMRAHGRPCPRMSWRLRVPCPATPSLSRSRGRLFCGSHVPVMACCPHDCERLTGEVMRPVLPRARHQPPLRALEHPPRRFQRCCRPHAQPRRALAQADPRGASAPPPRTVAADSALLSARVPTTQYHACLVVRDEATVRGVAQLAVVPELQ